MYKVRSHGEQITDPRFKHGSFETKPTAFSMALYSFYKMKINVLTLRLHKTQWVLVNYIFSATLNKMDPIREVGMKSYELESPGLVGTITIIFFNQSMSVY